jgi:hypothetical protein
MGLLNGISCSAKLCVAVGQTAAPFSEPGVPGPLPLINPGNGAGGAPLAEAYSG